MFLASRCLKRRKIKIPSTSMVINEVIIDTSVGPIDKKEIGNYFIGMSNLE